MNVYVAMVACGVGAILFVALRYAYFYLPLRELKRRATRNNPLLHKLTVVSTHQRSARLLLSFLAYSLAIITVILIARELSGVTAFIGIAVFLQLFSLASRKNSRLVVRLASFLAKYLEPVVRRLEPPAGVIVKRLHRKQRPAATRLYEKEDLKELIRVQKKAPNNRISERELNNALHALDFGTKKIKDYMVKHADIQFITTKEPIGPILLSELHKSGFSCFPVQGNSPREVVGMLHMEDLALHTEGGVVGDVMDTKVTYVSEDHNLEYVLQAFNQTGKRLCMVVDLQEKITGLISVTDVLEQILGHAISTEFESFDDPSAVAHG